jgi:hypothetical protein
MYGLLVQESQDARGHKKEAGKGWQSRRSIRGLGVALWTPEKDGSSRALTLDGFTVLVDPTCCFMKEMRRAIHRVRMCLNINDHLHGAPDPWDYLHPCRTPFPSRRRRGTIPG